ncbi:MAG: T9SS type A sorting domain-containing protein [Bacteroidetes bacterium]|nr:T9SS type A sorting domain-containing protein [Bacteroidota bacterium]
MRVNLLFFVLMGCFSNTFSQIYSVGNDDGFSFSCVGSVGSEVPLPIGLLSFEAKCNNRKVNLMWATASEINNDYFTIERTIDGVNFEIIGIIDGTGNSSQTMSYTFAHNEPLNGTSYYRLKQTDFNGQYNYFNLVAVSCNRITEFTIYPTPGTGTFIIEGAEQNSNVIITDVLGQIIFKTKIIGEKTGLDLSNQQTGIYFIQLIPLSICPEYILEAKKIIINK